MSEGPTNALSSAHDTPRVPPSWHAPAEFALHTIVGTGIFAIIAIPAVLLDLLVQKLTQHNMSNVVIWGLKFAEYSLFITDLTLFIVFLIKTSWRSAKKI